MEQQPKIIDCIQLVQRLPISKLDDNIAGISNLIYDSDDLLNEFLQKADNRTNICKDDPLGLFIQCEQNRDGDSYRSPHSNKYFPPLDEARYPSPELRDLEVKLNKMFMNYTRAYYTSAAISSCFCWEFGEKIEDGFGVSVNIKNVIDVEKELDSGMWDSCNVLSVRFEKEGENIRVKYKLTTTVTLQMAFHHKVCGKIVLSGTVSRMFQDEALTKSYLNEELHIETIGRMIEDAETSLRNSIEEIYVKKTKEIIDTARVSPILGRINIEQATKLKDCFEQIK